MADVGLGAADQPRPLLGRQQHRLLGGTGQRTDLLLEHVQVGHAVLQRLVARQRLAELLAHLEVLVGDLEQAARRAEGLGAQRHAGLVEGRGQHVGS
ncbi:hypothetical protein D3C80_1570870 [compost metagenome]